MRPGLFNISSKLKCSLWAGLGPTFPIPLILEYSGSKSFSLGLLSSLLFPESIGNNASLSSALWLPWPLLAYFLAHSRHNFKLHSQKVDQTRSNACDAFPDCVWVFSLPAAACQAGVSSHLIPGSLKGYLWVHFRNNLRLALLYLFPATFLPIHTPWEISVLLFLTAWPFPLQKGLVSSVNLNLQFFWIGVKMLSSDPSSNPRGLTLLMFFWLFFQWNASFFLSLS